MKNLYSLITSLLILMLAWASPVIAGNITIGYGIGPAKVSDSALFNDPYGRNLFIGNQTETLIGFEFGLFGIADNTKTTGADRVGIGGTSFTLTATIPTRYVSVFARAGIAHWSVFVNDVKQDSGATPTYGAGLNFNFNARWALRLEQQRYTEIGPTDSDVDHTRLGFIYTF